MLSLFALEVVNKNCCLTGSHGHTVLLTAQDKADMLGQPCEQQDDHELMRVPERLHTN